MTLSRGRVVSRSDLLTRSVSGVASGALGDTFVAGVASEAARLGVGRIAPRAVVDASLEASAILTRARAEAETIVAEAERHKSHVFLGAQVQARAQVAAELSTQALLLRHLENTLSERQLDRAVELGRVLAERLLGQALALDPTTIVALAQQALSEARGARRIRIDAHPADAATLSEHLELLGMNGEVSVLANADQARGNLRIFTDVGVLEAELGEQLAQLGARLRVSLTPEST